MSTLTAVVRLAWRGVRRQRLRSVVIVAMLAAPVAAGITLDVVLSSEHPSRVVATEELAGRAIALIAPVASANGDQAVRSPTQLPAGSLPPSDRATAEVTTTVTLYATQGTATAQVTVVGVDLRSGIFSPVLALTAGHEPVTEAEAALTPSLARSLGARPGSVIGVSGSTLALRVTGLVTNRDDGRARALYVPPVTAERLAAVATFPAPPARQWLVSGPAPITSADQQRLSRSGLSVVPRDAIVAEDGGVAGRSLPGSSVSPADPAVVRGLIVVMILLEIALLAGPAFAIGARRRRRDLATLSVAGARRAHLVGAALADGVILGVLAGLGGVALGWGIGAAIVTGQRAWSSDIPDSLTVHGWALAGVAVLAVATGLIAAVPAAWRAVRRVPGDPAAGASRRRPRRTAPGAPRRRPRRAVSVGLCAVVAAVVLAGTNLDASSGSRGPVALFAAAALGEIGLARVAPAVLSLAGRGADRLPIWPRLALRDASRHHSAAVPAVAAIIAVVAATATALVAGAAVAAHDRAGYTPYSIVGDAQTSVGAGQGGPATAAVDALRRVLPAADVLDLRGLSTCGLSGPARGCRTLLIEQGEIPGCPPIRTSLQDTGDGVDGGAVAFGSGFTGPASATCADRLAAERSSAVADDTLDPQVLVGGGAVAQSLIGGAAGRAAAAVLDGGRAVVFTTGLAGEGHVGLLLGGRHQAQVALPAVLVADPIPSTVAVAILPPGLATRVAVPVTDLTIYVKHATALPARTLAIADADLVRLGFGPLSTTSGYDNRLDRQLLIVAGADLALTVAAAVTSTLLISLDNESDLLILEALGATARGRRRLAASRAGLLCGIGALLGTVAGIIPGIGLVWRLRHITTTGAGIPGYPLDLPWARLAVVALAAPLAAVAVAALVVRTHPDVTRRDRR